MSFICPLVWHAATLILKLHDMQPSGEPGEEEIAFCVQIKQDKYSFSIIYSFIHLFIFMYRFFWFPYLVALVFMTHFTYKTNMNNLVKLSCRMQGQPIALDKCFEHNTSV